MRSKLSKYIIALVLVVYTAIIFAPPLMYAYVYPNTGDDTGNHLTYIEKLQNGEKPLYTYIGQYYVGKVLIWANGVTHIAIPTMFLWINFIVLWLVGIVVYLITASLTGWTQALIAIPISMFINPTLLNLFDDGSIFDLVTVAILTPILIYGFARMMQASKRTKIVVGVLVGIILIITVGLHSSAIFKYGFGSDEVVLPSFSYMIFLLGYGMVALMLMLVWAFYNKQVNLDRTAKIILIAIGVIVIGLGVLAFTRITIIPLRFAVNLVILVSVAVAILVSATKFSNVARYTVSALVVVVSIPNILTYMSDNSAIRPVDKEVITYVNQLDGDYYSCSQEVAPWVYTPFLNKRYKEGELPYIVRNKPMTPNSTLGTRYNWRTGYGDIDPIGSDKTVFSEDGIVVEVYYR